MDKSVKEIEIELMLVSAEVSALKEVLAEIRRVQASDTGAYGFSAVEREEIERHLAAYRNLKELDEIMDKMQKDEISRLLNIIKEKDAEIENLRAKITDRFPTMADFSSLQDEKELIEERLSENQSLDREIKRLREAIQGALRIDALWIPEIALEEHVGEAHALHKMRQTFLTALEETT